MLDLQRIRSEPEGVKKALADRGAAPALIDAILGFDERRRGLQASADKLKAQRNQIGPQIAKRKRAGEDASELLAEAGRLAAEIKQLTADQADAERQQHETMLAVANLALPEVPVGATAEENVELRRVGEPRAFDFEPLAAHTLAANLGLVDMERGAKLAGSSWPLYVGAGARLERALIQWFLDVNTGERGYTEMMTPFAANTPTLTGTGQLPKFADDLYKLADNDLYLIPTSEVTLTNIYRGETLAHAELPKLLTAYSPCFRREAGAHGAETRGLKRVHQFNKVELVRITDGETSVQAHEAMMADAELLLTRLGLHYRALVLSTGDMGFGAAKTIDLEVWAPASGAWHECSSISNCLDFQARRMNLRYRDADGKLQFCHTLNGSGLATPRIYLALLETYQEADGGVRIPEVLQPYMGCERIAPPADR